MTLPYIPALDHLHSNTVKEAEMAKIIEHINAITQENFKLGELNLVTDSFTTEQVASLKETLISSIRAFKSVPYAKKSAGFSKRKTFDEKKTALHKVLKKYLDGIHEIREKLIQKHLEKDQQYGSFVSTFADQVQNTQEYIDAIDSILRLGAVSNEFEEIRAFMPDNMGIPVIEPNSPIKAMMQFKNGVASIPISFRFKDGSQKRIWLDSQDYPDLFFVNGQDYGFFDHVVEKNEINDLPFVVIFNEQGNFKTLRAYSKETFENLSENPETRAQFDQVLMVTVENDHLIATEASDYDAVEDAYIFDVDFNAPPNIGVFGMMMMGLAGLAQAGANSTTDNQPEIKTNTGPNISLMPANLDLQLSDDAPKGLSEEDELSTTELHEEYSEEASPIIFLSEEYQEIIVLIKTMLRVYKKTKLVSEEITFRLDTIIKKVDSALSKDGKQALHELKKFEASLSLSKSLLDNPALMGHLSQNMKAKETLDIISKDLAKNTRYLRLLQRKFNNLKDAKVSDKIKYSNELISKLIQRLSGKVSQRFLEKLQELHDNETEKISQITEFISEFEKSSLTPLEKLNETMTLAITSVKDGVQTLSKENAAKIK